MAKKKSEPKPPMKAPGLTFEDLVSPQNVETLPPQFQTLVSPTRKPATPVEELAASIADLARRAATIYAPIVDELVHTRSTNIRHIEHTLDGLLGFCFDPEMLLLYKKLCRHYDLIDPAATADYVHAYREMWDSDSEAQP